MIVIRDRDPKVQLTLKEQCTPDQEAALLAGEIQFGFLHPPVDERLALQPILQEPMLLALPENHPLAQQPSVSGPLSDLLSLDQLTEKAIL